LAVLINRYAQALVDVSFKLGQHEIVEQELDQFDQLLRQNQELRAFYMNPAISGVKKKAATLQLISKLDLSKIASNFILVLVSRNRITHFTEILEAVRQGIRDCLGIVQVEVTTSIKIDMESQYQLGLALRDIIGKEVKLQFEINPDILGGVITRVDDTIYDGSVLQQLHLIKSHLSS